MNKRLDVIILVLLMIAGLFYAFATASTFFGKPLVVCVMFMLPPIVYLGLREKKNWKKILVATVLFGAIFAFPFDFIAEYTKSWSVINLVFPWKILGVEPIDNVIAYILFTALTIVFYQHFIDKEKKKNISKNVKWGFAVGIAILLFFLFAYFFNHALLSFQYPYFTMGLIAIIPPIVLGFIRPDVFKKMAVISVYFFFLYFAFEYCAVRNNYWIYTGNNYVGWVNVFGATFPFEELFFWMLLYAPALVAYYKIFIDE